MPNPKHTALTLAAMAAVLAVGFDASQAHAQARLHLDSALDLDMGYTASDTLDDYTLLARIGGGLGTDTNQNNTRRAALDVLAGWVGKTPRDLAQAHFQLDVLSGPGDHDQSTTNGRHKVYGRFGLGKNARGSTGLDLELDATVDHGVASGPFTRPDLGQGQFMDVDVDSTVAWQRGVASDQAVVVPLTYGLRMVRTDDPMGGGFTTHTLSSGYGPRDYLRYVHKGGLRLFGVSWARTHFEVAPSTQDDDAKRAASNNNPHLDHVQLQIMRFDEVVVEGLTPFGRQTVVAATGYVGWSWLEREGQPRASMPAFDLHGAMRFHATWMRFHLGIGGGHEPAHTLDGQHITRLWRLESIMGFDIPVASMGGELKAASLWQYSARPGAEPMGQRHGLDSQWWFEPIDRLQVGLYHHAQRGRPDGETLWGRSKAWDQEIGVFLKLRGGRTGTSRSPGSQIYNTYQAYPEPAPRRPGIRY